MCVVCFFLLSSSGMPFLALSLSLWPYPICSLLSSVVFLGFPVFAAAVPPQPEWVRTRQPPSGLVSAQSPTLERPLSMLAMDQKITDDLLYALMVNPLV